MQGAKPVLVISDAGKERDAVVETLAACEVRCATCANLKDASALLAQQNFGAIFCSDALPSLNLGALVRGARPVPIVVISRVAEWPAYLSALRSGAFDYIACPPNPAETERILGVSSRRVITANLWQNQQPDMMLWQN